MPEESRQRFEDFLVNLIPLGGAGTVKEAAVVALSPCPMRHPILHLISHS